MPSVTETVHAEPEAPDETNSLSGKSYPDRNLNQE
jgi:hypothetical protein